MLNGVLTNNIPSSFASGATRDLQDASDEVFSFGLNVSHDVGDWNLTADLSYSTAEGDNRFDRIQTTNQIGDFSFNTQLRRDGFDIELTPRAGGTLAQYLDPATYTLTTFDDRFATNDDEEYAIQFDAIREVDSNFLSSIEMGARVRGREKSATRRSNGNGIPAQSLNIPLGDNFILGPSNFLDGGLNAPYNYSDLLFPDNAALRASSQGHLGCQWTFYRRCG